MEAILNSVSDPSDLLNVSDPRLPYRFEQIFSAEGFGAKRLERNRLKLIKEIDPVVQRLLTDGEQVEFVTWGVDYSFAEQFFMGIWSQLINRRALVFTDRRILLIQINSRRKALDLKAQIRFECIDSFAKGTFGYLGFVLRNRKKLLLTGIPRKDRKAIRSLIANRLERTASNAIGAGTGVENLCPKCGNKVMGFPDRCNQCAIAFKSARKAGYLSLAFPGLGDLYLGHRWLGWLEMIGGTFAWCAIALPMALAAQAGDGDWIAVAAAMAIVFTFVHVPDCWITRRVGFKGIYPLNK